VPDANLTALLAAQATAEAQLKAAQAATAAYQQAMVK
jgi:hypothetical protein